MIEALALDTSDRCVDWILVRGDYSKLAKFGIFGDSDLCHTTEKKQEQWTWASDHFSVYADLNFRNLDLEQAIKSADNFTGINWNEAVEEIFQGNAREYKRCQPMERDKRIKRYQKDKISYYVDNSGIFQVGLRMLTHTEASKLTKGKEILGR